MKLIRQIVLTVTWTELLAKPMPLSRMGIDGRRHQTGAQFSIAEIGVLFPRLFLRFFPRY